MQPTNNMKTYSQVLEMANEMFANNENKAAIIEGIKNKLIDMQYDEAQKNNRRVQVNFGWDYTGWAQSRDCMDSTEFKVKKSVMNFFNNLYNIDCSIDK